MSNARRWSALGLAALSLPLMIMALIDPLEGSLPLIAALLLTLIVRLISRVPIPRVELGGIIAAVALGAVTLVIAALASGTVPDGSAIGSDVTVSNPLGIGERILVWVYRAAVIVAAVGAVQYLMRLVQVLLNVPVARRARS